MRKQTLLFSSIGLLMLTGLFACKKDNGPKIEYNSLEVIVKKNENSVTDLGMFGDEEGAAIVVQARHYQESSVIRTPATGRSLYLYTPQQNFTGEDSVKIKAGYGSDGSGPATRIVFTTIRLRVLN